MRIAVFGKFPPIQGGVSVDVLDFVISARNHSVHLFTNSDEVEAGFRSLFKQSDFDWLRANTAHAEIHQTEGLGGRAYTPFANPFLTKLLGLADNVFQEQPFDLVLGWYLEPYAVAAGLIASLYDLPLFVRTAGSDVGALSYNRDLASSYRRVMSTAYAVLGGAKSPDRDERFHALGLDEAKMVSLRGNKLPGYFRKKPDLLPLDWRSEIEGARNTAPVKDRWIYDCYHRFNDATAFEPTLPTVGVYGKIGDVKGTYDLMQAACRLSSAGKMFNLLWMPSGDQTRLRRFFDELAPTRERVPHLVIVPPTPPWRVPEFLARCDIGCVLERDFPITFHGPQLPREVLSSRAALLISREVSAKQTFSMNLVHGKNCFIVEDPKDHETLAAAICRLIEDRELTKYIGRHGQFLSKTIEAFMPETNSMLKALTDLMEERRCLAIAS